MTLETIRVSMPILTWAVTFAIGVATGIVLASIRHR